MIDDDDRCHKGGNSRELIPERRQTYAEHAKVGCLTRGTREKGGNGPLFPPSLRFAGTLEIAPKLCKEGTFALAYPLSLASIEGSIYRRLYFSTV